MAWLLSVAVPADFFSYCCVHTNDKWYKIPNLIKRLSVAWTLGSIGVARFIIIFDKLSLNFVSYALSLHLRVEFGHWMDLLCGLLWPHGLFTFGFIDGIEIIMPTQVLCAARLPMIYRFIIIILYGIVF